MMDNLKSIFTENDFKLTKETSKAIEFENIHTGDVIYLLPNKEISIVLNPNTVEENKGLQHNSHGIYNSTALSLFPKRVNTGLTPITYGYSYKFKTENELNQFLTAVNLIIFHK
ncbi:hypothetical protein [Fictibacillus sp. BK138]|uniref:hypothetical protein n=1 Tax=Fictibacillus sp. BK138 TaxID=2512121 RepID=UPI0010E420F4|nr:hypothetical protein [Fictibacillus sp. BK138]RZT16519.1 hypothetical protein EV282_3626 [Fictibacillus sp. BK138]